MKVLAAVLVCLLAASASALVACGQDGIECEGRFVLTEESQPVLTLADNFPAFPEVDVTFNNATVAELALQAEDVEEATANGMLTGPSSNGVVISISVGEVAAWLNSGGNNPLETGIIRKILDFLNGAGINISGGSLIYEFNNGPEMELQGGCSDVHLQGGWNARAHLRSGTRVTLTFGVNDWTLVVGSHVHSDCDFGMGGRVRARFGKKVFGKCIRVLSKTESINIGADMAMNVISRLELRPTINIDAQLNVLIGLSPLYQIRGELLKFEPRGRVSITIFGIHIGFIERAIANGIRDGIKRAFNQRTVDAQFAAATASVQNALNQALSGAVVKIPLVPQQYVPSLQAAVNNIKSKQATNM